MRTRAAGQRCRSRPEHRCAGPRCNSRCPHRRSPPAAPPRRSTTGHGRVHGARLTGKASRTGPRVPGIRFPGPAKRRASQRPSRTGPRAAARQVVLRRVFRQADGAVAALLDDVRWGRATPQVPLPRRRRRRHASVHVSQEEWGDGTRESGRERRVVGVTRVRDVTSWSGDVTGHAVHWSCSSGGRRCGQGSSQPGGARAAVPGRQRQRQRGRDWVMGG